MSLTRQSPSQVEKVCEICHAPFFVLPWRVKGNAGRFCSPSCRGKSRQTKIEISCERCGTLFWEVPSVIAIGQGKFCSRECAITSNTTNWTEKICQHCGVAFDVKISEVNRGGGKFCSRDCYDGRPLKSLENRFWEKTNRNGPIPAHCPELGNCWLWTGANNGESETRKWPYGLIGKGRQDGGNLKAHHVSWELHYGPVPTNMIVIHQCDFTLCVRPDHLRIGTLKDNTQDMLAKNRHKIEKLTPDQVQEIRARYATGDITQTELAGQYGVSTALVSSIITRKIWTQI